MTTYNGLHKGGMQCTQPHEVNIIFDTNRGYIRAAAKLWQILCTSKFKSSFSDCPGPFLTVPISFAVDVVYVEFCLSLVI